MYLVRWGESDIGVVILKPEQWRFFRNMKLFQGLDSVGIDVAHSDDNHQSSTLAVTKKLFVGINLHFMLRKSQQATGCFH
jgi:hypothetical protein